MLKKMFIFVLLFFLIFQLVTPTSITLAENTSKKLTTKATPYADGQTDFPPIPAGVKPIDIGNKFNFTGDGIYQSSFMYEMTGVSMLSSQAWSVARYNLTRPFEIEFYTYLGDATKEGTADGIALAFHNNENFTVGDNGSGMGTYSKDLGKASVLEFDTYYNDAVNSKPTGDHDVDILDETVMNMTTGQPNHVGHVAIRSSDANGNVGTHKLITTGTASAPLANGQWERVHVKWEPKTHTLTGSIGSHNFSTDYDIRKDLKDPENTIFGITSSTAIYETSQGIFFSKLQIPTKPHGELETEKLADKNTVKPGETVTYTLVAKNIKENTTLENITIEDNLEEGLELDPTSLQLDGQVVANEATGNNIKVTIPEIEGIGESRVTFKAKVTKTTNGIIKNIAVVTDPEDPVTPIFPEVPIEVVDAPGKLAAEKLVSKKQARPGDILTYTIVARNILDDTILKNITIEDTLPVGLELVPNSVKINNQTVTNNGVGNEVKVTIPSIPGVGLSRVVFQAKVTKTDDGIITNTAIVTDPNEPTKPIKPEVPVEVISHPGILETEKLVDEAVAKPGDIVTYTIVARNILEDSILKEVLVQDELPNGVELVNDSIELDGVSIENEVAKNNHVQITIPEISGGGESQISFKVKITQEYNGEIINVALVTDPEDPENPQEPEVPLEVVDAPGKLAAEKLVNHNTVKPGDTVTYTIKAKNILDKTVLKDVLVEDEIPEGLELIEDSIELDGESVENEGDETQVIVTIPEIKGIGESKVTFKVKVTKVDNGEIKNIAVVTDPNDPDKPIKPEIPIEVVDGAGKLEAEKLVNHTVVKPGDTVTYTIKAQNILDQTILKNILVEDEIPEGLELDEDSIELDGKSVVNEGNENQLAVTIPEIKGIGESKVTFKAKVIKIDSGEIKNIAVVTDPNDPEEPQKPEIEIEVVEMPGVLQAKKTVSQSIVKPGDVVTYKIAAKNTLKGSVLNNILIEDELPDGVEFIEGSLRLGDEKVENEGSDKQIKVTIPEIIGVSEKHITFQVKVTKTTNGIVKNIAVVTDPKDPEEPKKPEVPVEVIKNPGQLDVEKLADKQNITPGNTLTYTLIARNTLANSVLKQVVIEDTLPKYVTLVPGTLKLDGKKVSNEGSNNHIKVTAPKITGLKESRVTFKVKVALDAKGTIKNIEKVTNPLTPKLPMYAVNKVTVIKKGEENLPGLGDTGYLYAILVGVLLLILGTILALNYRKRKLNI